MKEINENALKDVSGGKVVCANGTCGEFQKSYYAMMIDDGEAVCKNCKFFVVVGSPDSIQIGGMCTK